LLHQKDNSTVRKTVNKPTPRSFCSTLLSKSLSKPLSALLFSFLLGLLVSACGGGNDTADGLDFGLIRTINAVSDSPTVAFTVDSSSLGTAQFGQATAFLSIQEGNYDISAGFANLADDVVTLLSEEEVTVDISGQLTLVLAGTVASPVSFVIEETTEEAPTDSTELRLLNTAAAGNLDLYVTGVDAPLDAPILSAASNSASPAANVTAGESQIRLTTAGSDVVIFDSGSFVLPAGQRLVLHAAPYFGPGDNPVDLNLISSASTSSFPLQQLPASVRVANAISDLPAVDAVIQNNTATSTVESLATNTFSSSIDLVAGSAAIDITLETDPGTVLVSSAAELAGGDRRTLIATGSFSDDSTAGRLAIDPQRPIASSAQINFMNGSASAGTVDVYLLSAGETVIGSTANVPNLALLANSNIEVLGGTYELVFTRAGEDGELAGPVSVTVANNGLFSFLLTDAEGGGEPPQIIEGPAFE